MSAPIRLGFCGGGWVVRNCYAPALERCSRRLPVTAIVEPNATHWPSLRILFPEAEIAATREALFAGLVDAVVVASPNASHLDDAVATLEAGIPCLVEKPVLRNSADLGRLRRAASRGRVALLPSAACRHRADARSWLECCSQIAPLRRLDLVWHRHRGVPATDWHLAASDGWTGVLADLGPHLLDLAGAALKWQCDGLLLRRRTAFVPSFAAPAGWYGGGATREMTVCDQFAAEITLAGCSLTLSLRWRDDEPGDLVRLEAVGDRGRCCLEGLFGFSGERRVAHQRLMTTTGGIGAVQDFAPGTAPQIAGFAAMLDNFATRCCEGWSEAPDLAFLARVGDALAAVEA